MPHAPPRQLALHRLQLFLTEFQVEWSQLLGQLRWRYLTWLPDVALQVGWRLLGGWSLSWGSSWLKLVEVGRFCRSHGLFCGEAGNSRNHMAFSGDSYFSCYFNRYVCIFCSRILLKRTRKSQGGSCTNIFYQELVILRARSVRWVHKWQQPAIIAR